MRELVACASCSFAAVTRHASGALVARHDEIRSLMVAQLHSFREAQPCEKIKSDVKSGPPAPRNILHGYSTQKLADT